MRKLNPYHNQGVSYDDMRDSRGVGSTAVANTDAIGSLNRDRGNKGVYDPDAMPRSTTRQPLNTVSSRHVSARGTGRMYTVIYDRLGVMVYRTADDGRVYLTGSLSVIRHYLERRDLPFTINGATYLIRAGVAASVTPYRKHSSAAGRWHRIEIRATN